VTFSPDGGRLAAGTDPSSHVHVWKLDQPNRSEEFQATGPNPSFEQLMFSPDGRFLGACHYAFESVQVWDTRKPGAAPVSYKGLEGEAGSLRYASFSPDSQRLAAVDFIKGTVLIWELNRPEVATAVLRRQRDPGQEYYVSFSPDGASLVLATDWWEHLVRIDESALAPVASRPLDGHFPFFSQGAVRFLEPTGRRIQVAVLPTMNTVLPSDVRFDTFEAPPLEGDANGLLADWSKRLALRVTEEGEVVPTQEAVDPR
jgi:hypothetical protein